MDWKQAADFLFNGLKSFILIFICWGPAVNQEQCTKSANITANSVFFVHYMQPVLTLRTYLTWALNIWRDAGKMPEFDCSAVSAQMFTSLKINAWIRLQIHFGDSWMWHRCITAEVMNKEIISYTTSCCSLHLKITLKTIFRGSCEHWNWSHWRLKGPFIMYCRWWGTKSTVLVYLKRTWGKDGDQTHDKKK